MVVYVSRAIGVARASTQLRLTDPLSPGIGGFVVLTNVASTETFLGSGDTPVIRTARNFVVVHDNFLLPERPLQTRGTGMSGGIMNGVKVLPHQLDVYETNCEGRMCDQSTLFANGVLMPHCACMQMNKSGKVMLVFTMKVTQENGNEFDVTFASKWFMLNFLLTGPLPVGTCASNFEDYEVEDRLWTATASVFEYINEKGGFRAFVWAKRGLVEDAGVDQPEGYRAQKSTIESGLLNHHIVRLEPMVPSAIDLAELKSRQFNVDTGFRTGDLSEDEEERSTSSRTNEETSTSSPASNVEGGGSTSPRLNDLGEHEDPEDRAVL